MNPMGSRAEKTDQTAGVPGGRWLRAAAGLVCGAVFVILFLQSVNMSTVLARMADIVWLPVIVGLVAFILDFVLRSVRFWMLLDGREHKLPIRPMIAPFIASFGISDILPLRLGDVFRVYWFNRKFRLPVSKVLAAMILERTFDLVSIVFLAALTLLIVQRSIDGQILFVLQMALAATALGGITVILSPHILNSLAKAMASWRGDIWNKVAEFLLSLSNAISGFGSMPRIMGHFIFSLLIWILESVVVLGAWIGLAGPANELAKPFFAFTISTIGTLVPALPGHFGSYEYFGILAFDAIQVERSLAAAVILIAHLVLWLPTAIFGICWLVWTGQTDALRLNKKP